MLNSKWCQMGAIPSTGDCGELLPDASHRVRGAGLGGPKSDALRAVVAGEPLLLPGMEGRELLQQRSGGEKQFVIPVMRPTPHWPGEKIEA